MKKLFPTQSTLQISPFEKIHYNGNYKLEKVADDYFECDVQKFRLQLAAKTIKVQYLYEEGFLIHFDTLHKLSIERNEK